MGTDVLRGACMGSVDPTLQLWPGRYDGRQALKGTGRRSWGRCPTDTRNLTSSVGQQGGPCPAARLLLP